MCGFIGLHAGPDAAFEMADGLLVLQHRGQDAAGVTTFDGEAFHTHRAAGRGQEIFTGPILGQWTVSVLPGDTAEDLAARVLWVEHGLYPRAVDHLCAAIAEGTIDAADRGLFHTTGDVREAKRVIEAR